MFYLKPQTKFVLIVFLFKSIECATQLFPVHLNNNGNGSSFRYQLNHKFNDNSFNDYGSMTAQEDNFGYNHNRGGKAYASSGGLNSNSLNPNSHDSSLWTSNEDVTGGQSVNSNSLLDTPVNSGGGRESYNNGGDLATAADGHILGYGHHAHHLSHGGGWSGWSPPKTFHYQIYPNKGYGHGHGHHHHGHHHHHIGWGWNYDQGWGDYGHELWDKFSGWIGLKGVNVKSFITSLLISIPIILGLLVLLFFLPVPVWVQTSPFCARTNSKLMQETGRLTREILESEQCVERISCEVEKMARKFDKAQWIHLILKNAPKSKWMNRISTTINKNEKMTSKDVKCSKFSCNPLSHIKKSFKLE